MQDLCKRVLKDPNAWAEPIDTFDCKQLRCKRKDESSTIWTKFMATVEIMICGLGGGRCFRGRCRVDGKLIKNVGHGNCIQTPDRFYPSVLAKMGICPSSKDRTALNTVDIWNMPGDKRLATPFTYAGNKENWERCMYVANVDGGIIWTDR